MIQDIAPHKYHVEYTPCAPTSEDILFIFKGNSILVREENGRTWFPSVGGFDIKNKPVFLFKIDDTNIFMTDVDEGVKFEGWDFVKPEYFRTAAPHWKAFAGITAMQLHRWYAENKFCSRCGAKMKRGTYERSVICTDCGKTVYPRISPCVIVALTDNDRIMLTKYSTNHSAYRRYSLIAGYNEVGETLEDTVRREVMEEVGLKVKNIRYFKNQPWSFSDTLLVGFFCELDGKDTPKIDSEELSEATWFKRSDIPATQSLISLTNTMIEHFRNNGS